MVMIIRILVLLATLVVLLNACSSPEDTMDPAVELAARPTSEQMLTRYEQMYRDIQDRLDTEIGPFEWYQTREGGQAGCGTAFPAELGGRTVALPSWGFNGNIVDQDWARARDIITAVTVEYGFASGGVQIDEPGRHTLNAFDTTLGAYFTFGTDINTSMQTTTGCHLPAAVSSST